MNASAFDDVQHGPDDRIWHLDSEANPGALATTSSTDSAVRGKSDLSEAYAVNGSRITTLLAVAEVVINSRRRTSSNMSCVDPFADRNHSAFRDIP